MIDVKTTNEVIKQRALGLSFDDIVTVTGISKPTVIRICNENIDMIADAKAVAATVARADIASEINKRRLHYTKLVSRCIEELMRRDLTSMNNGNLTRVLQGAERALGLLESNDKNIDRPTDEWRPMSVERAMAIIDSLDDE